MAKGPVLGTGEVTHAGSSPATPNKDRAMKETYRSPAFNLQGYVAFTVKYSDGTKKTALEHREIMEKHLGRRLKRNEVVHHKDGDRGNNAVMNLEVLSGRKHVAHHQKHRTVEMTTFTCPECGNTAFKEARYVRHNRKQNKEGPFCGRSCAGKMSKRKQKAP